MNERQLPYWEFILLMACMVALDAFSIDAMLPALGQIAEEFGVTSNNHRQYVITSIFLGFLFGVLVFGFVADRYGRRKPAIIGFTLHIVGSVLCIVSSSFSELLLGRVLQGMGAAGPYVLSVVIVRDQYQGRAMARILSLVMMVFIGVPMVAPFIGQFVLQVAGWRSIFGALLMFSVFVLIWFILRQAETLKPENRKPISMAQIGNAICTVYSNKVSRNYLVCLGAMSGAFIAYLSTAQQVFQGVYRLGVWFPLVFASLAACFGIASYFNARWVEKVGSKLLIHYALSTILVFTLAFLVAYVVWAGKPPLVLYLFYLSVVIATFAFQFSNFTALALEPLGSIAGAASSIVNASSTAIAIVLATVIGSQLKESVLPVVLGFGVLGLFAWCLNFTSLKSQAAFSKHTQ